MSRGVLWEVGGLRTGAGYLISLRACTIRMLQIIWSYEWIKKIQHFIIWGFSLVYKHSTLFNFGGWPTVFSLQFVVKVIGVLSLAKWAPKCCKYVCSVDQRKVHQQVLDKKCSAFQRKTNKIVSSQKIWCFSIYMIVCCYFCFEILINRVKYYYYYTIL